jgi:hypothetical protein
MSGIKKGVAGHMTDHPTPLLPNRRESESIHRCIEISRPEKAGPARHLAEGHYVLCFIDMPGHRSVFRIGELASRNLRNLVGSSLFQKHVADRLKISISV